ncbi:MAG: pentapeptide repeat-containing protein [Nostoc sp.]|uniref:pentapeptide repeat-containing protein n=1 Tax=Nostoc sp. TaxID=1180 RepID=UPI002FF6234C
MKVKRQRITVEELLSRYAAGERDFTCIAIYESRKGLLRGVDLSGINLEDSSLSVDFSGAILREANFRYTVWGKCSWEKADFSSSDFTGINNGVECVFVRCNFSNTNWE